MAQIKNGISYLKNGWTYISVEGEPKERGYALGYLAAADFKKVQEMLKFSINEDMGLAWDSLVDLAATAFKPTIQTHFKEIYDEMEGIAEGCTAAGTPTTLDEIIAWNNFYTLADSWLPKHKNKSTGANKGSREGGAKDHCSAFIATGEYTKDGKIVMAHNSFTNFMDGQYYNYIVNIKPPEGSGGHTILMQSFPCGIWSGTDFFVTSAGIMGTETTIGGFIAYKNRYTIACRIRKAMQYGKTLDDYVDILWKGNSGDYANTWFFGDIGTNEILSLELGLEYKDVKRTTNGYFIGCNVAFNPQIRNLECVNTGYCDVRRHQGARQVRLPDLMEEWKGKIDVEKGKEIIADHYDVYLNKDNKSARCVCAHYELDGREYMSDPSRPKPFQPRGAVDGSVMDSNLGAKMSFSMRWGNSCGTPFDAAAFCDKNRQWKHLLPLLHDRPTQPWTLFSSTDLGEHKKASQKIGKEIKRGKPPKRSSSSSSITSSRSRSAKNKKDNK